MDLARLAGVDYTEILVAGTLYKVGRLSLREWAQLQAFLKAKCPSPISALRSEELVALSKEDRLLILKLAFEETKAWPPRIGTTAWFRAIDDAPGGQAELLRAIVAKFQPEVTFERCEEIAAMIELPEAIVLCCHAMGVDPDPKSQSPVDRGPNKRQKRRERKPTESAPSPISSLATGAGPSTRSST